MIEPDGVRRKSVVDGIPIDEGKGVIDGLLTDTEWDEEENETVEDSDEVMSLVEVPPLEDEPEPKPEGLPADPELKADLECLSRLEKAVLSEKQSSSVSMLPFLIRVENMVAGNGRGRKH